MTRQRFAPSDIGDMYDEHSRIAAAFRDGQSHMAYWYDDEDPVELTAAVHRLTTKVTETLGLRSGETVLDAGCGPGETSVHMATRWGARVTGVTISAFEVEAGRRRAEAAGVSDLARFQHGDYSELPFADGTFDAVLAMESLLFAPDLPQVLDELCRVLRPGGRLSISDISLEPTAEPERVERFAAAVKLNVLMPLPEWLSQLKNAGFLVEEFTQCGPRTFGRKAKLIKASMRRRTEMAAEFGEEAIAKFASQQQGVFLPRKDQIGYIIIAAAKPRH